MEDIINKVKTVLGHPLRRVEVTDEMIETLIQLSEETWSLYSKDDKSKEEVKKIWVTQYTIGTTKEVLGRVRGKFSGKVDDLTLDYESLLAEANTEKATLLEYFNR